MFGVCVGCCVFVGLGDFCVCFVGCVWWFLCWIFVVAGFGVVAVGFGDVWGCCLGFFGVVKQPVLGWCQFMWVVGMLILVGLFVVVLVYGCFLGLCVGINDLEAIFTFHFSFEWCGL